MDDQLRDALDGLSRGIKEREAALTERMDQIEIAMQRPPAVGDPAPRGNAREFNNAVARFVRTGDQTVFHNVMETGSGPDGGYVVHPVISTVWTKKIFDASIMRQISRVETITAGDAWIEPVDWGQPDAVCCAICIGR